MIYVECPSIPNTWDPTPCPVPTPTPMSDRSSCLLPHLPDQLCQDSLLPPPPEASNPSPWHSKRGDAATASPSAVRPTAGRSSTQLQQLPWLWPSTSSCCCERDSTNVS